MKSYPIKVFFFLKYIEYKFALIAFTLFSTVLKVQNVR